MLAVTTIGIGRPVVVLPGFGLDSAVMASAFEPVFASTEGWQRLYLDLPGTGGSAPVEPTSDAVLDAVHCTIETVLGRTPFLVAGHSYGGYLAAGLARRVPAQVAGLLGVCSGVRTERDRRDLTSVLGSEPGPDWLADVPSALHAHFGQAIGAQTRAVGTRVAAAIALAGPMQEEYLDRLRSTGYRLSDQDSIQVFEGPVALLAGRRDRIAGYLDQFSALAQYPNGSFTAVAEAGHYLPFEQPDIFAALTLDWLARSGPSRIGSGAGP